MALTDEGSNNGFVMPVSPLYGGGGNNPTGRNQYSREGGYSYAEDMEATKEEIRELSMEMPEEHRRKIERALDDLR